MLKNIRSFGNGAGESEMVVHHTVPIDWGRLRVSAAAVEAYRLIHTPGFVDDNETPGLSQFKGIPYISLDLLAPDEIAGESERVVLPELEFSETELPLAVKHQATVKLNGIAIRMAYDKSRAEVQEAMGEAEFAKAEVGIEQRTGTQAFAEITARQFSKLTRKTVLDWCKYEDDKAALKDVTNLGAVALGGGLVLTIVAFNSRSELIVDGTFAFLFAYFAVVRKRLSDHFFKDSEEKKQSFNEFAADKSQEVYSRIQDAYVSAVK